MPMSQRVRVPRHLRVKKFEMPSTTKEAVAQRLALFTEEYLRTGGDRNAAAKHAGFLSTGFSVLKKHPELNALIDKRRAEILEADRAKTLLTVQDVLSGLKAAHDEDVRCFFNKDGSFKHPSQLTKEQAQQIEGLEIEEEFALRKTKKGKRAELVKVVVVKVKFAKRISVRDQAMRHLGLYAKDNAQRNGTPQEFAESVRRELAMIDRQTGGEA